MALLIKKAILLAKEEGTYGADPTHAGTDTWEIISDLVITPVGELQTRYPFGQYLSQARPLMGAHWVEVSFIVELKGSGTAGTTPVGLSDLFEACGMLETDAADVQFTPTSASMKSIALEVYADGLFHQILGCRGTFRILLVTGETGKVEFRFLGKYLVPTDVAVPTPTYASTVPPTMISGSFTWATDAEISITNQIEFDIGNVLAVRKSLNDATGVAGIEITGREPKGSFSPEACLIAGYDIWTDWSTSLEKAITITLGDTAGNRYIITAPKAVPESIGYGDRDGVRTFEIPFRLAKNAGDDEINIKHN